MLESYLDIVDQEYQRVSGGGRNILLVHYNGELSQSDMKLPEKMKAKDGPAVVQCEYDYRAIQEPIEPFLGMIYGLVMKFGDGDLEAFMEQAGVYELHKDIFRFYWKTGEAVRREPIIRTELEYEKKRMIDEIVSMIFAAAELHPFLLILNRMQIANHSTVEVLYQLARDKRKSCFGIILGLSDSVAFPTYTAHLWEKFTEYLDDEGCIASIGTAGNPITMNENIPHFRDLGEKHFISIRNHVTFLDIQTAEFYIDKMLPLLEDDAFGISEETKVNAYYVAFQATFLMPDLSHALDIVGRLETIYKADPDAMDPFYYRHLLILLRMYQNELKEAQELLQEGLKDPGLTEEWRFVYLLREAMVRMSAWNNIFFCRENLQLSEELISGLKKRGYYNHLAYIELYAYDNDKASVEKAVDKKSPHFEEVLRLVEKTGNRFLMNLAYEKNIMISSSYGLNHIALYYFHMGTMDLSHGVDHVMGESFNGIGYNLSALGHYEEAEQFYRKALYAFHALSCLEDVSETFYNMAMNRIAMGSYYEAEDALNACVKVIRHLRLNRLRVCNISKLYALLSLTSVLQGNLFTAEQYERRAANFLDYYISRGNQMDLKHDYSNYDDEILILCLARALIADRKGLTEEAGENFRMVASYLEPAGGNVYYCKAIYYENYVRYLRENSSDSDALREMESEFKAYAKNLSDRRAIEVSQWIELSEEFDDLEISGAEIDRQLGEVEARKQAKTLRRNMEFLQMWQRLLNVEDMNPRELLENAMRRFQGYFSVDRCMYLQFADDKLPKVLYNNTDVEVSTKLVEEIRKSLRMNIHGFAVSKMSNEYSDYSGLLDCFGGGKVCSMVVIPYLVGSRLDTVFLTYVEMRESWFSMVNHYMLDEEDRAFFEVLFREANLALKRIESNHKIREMNRLLYQSAITDQLTGVRNRTGLYRFVNEITTGSREDFRGRMAIMFIDLDNFKPYNDKLGHEAGDVVLKGMSRIFEQALGSWGIVARYGGDEFILLIRTDERSILLDIAEEIYAQIDKANGFETELRAQLGEIPEEYLNMQIGCSIGIATTLHNDASLDVQELINEADKVLYEVKNEAKGTYRFLE